MKKIWITISIVEASVLKKVFLILFTLVFMVFTFTSCDIRFNRYNAIGLVRTSNSHSAYLKFYSLEGSLSFKFTYDGTNSAHIEYKGELEEGSITVYCEAAGNKSELFTINAGDKFVSSGGNISKGTTYIIIETNEKCQNGEFEFAIQAE